MKNLPQHRAGASGSVPPRNRSVVTNTTIQQDDNGGSRLEAILVVLTSRKTVERAVGSFVSVLIR